MKKLILLAFTGMMLLNSCKKNQSDENYHETDESQVPVFTERVSADVAGFIMDEQNNPVAGATVTAGNLTGSTDEYGYFRINNASLVKNIGLVKIVKEGYFTGFKTFPARQDEDNFFRFTLLSKAVTGTVAAATGGIISTADGASVTLPANGIVDASSGAAYSGQVHVSIRNIPVNAVNESLFSLPGDGRGLNTDSHLKILNHNTAIAVDLNGDAGQKLQLAASTRAAINMPIPASLQSKAPASITLWSFDEEKGLWKEEGTLTKSGSQYTGQTTHFSYWSGATGVSLVNFSAQVLNTSLQPVANVPVLITIAGQPLNAGYGKFAFTDASGHVSGALPANTSFVLNVMSTCSNSSYDHAFSTNSSDIDLGALTGNLGQGMVTLTGTVTNCSGQPVTNGYVQTYDHGFYNRIPVVNGSFSFTGLACTNLPVSYIAVDLDTHQQNDPQSITLAAGSNNLGALSACGTSTLGSVSYTINGITRTITEPTDTLGAYYTQNGITAIVKLSGGSGSSSFTFQFNGGIALGSGHKVSDVWSVGFPSGRGYATAGNELDVNITEYGNVGGFVSGSFSGTLLDFGDNSTQNVQYTFRIKRLN
ncbi:MAG: carboxypeptidase-like regulatory domain-containing protein [Ferruginibacter sp.]